MRMPPSKQRNKHIQHVLIEAAKLAPRQSAGLALIHQKVMEKGNKQGNAGRSSQDGGMAARSGPGAA
jgi:hypothetical protein